jgi:GNAT superfamily N-acetyltransferase
MARRTQSSDTSFKLDDYDLGQFSLMRPTRLGAKRLAIDLVKIDPWRTLQIDQLKLAASLIDPDKHLHRWLIHAQGTIGGAVAIRHPWLYGPYLALLAVMPDRQGQGIGAAVLRWMEREVAGKASNLWVCVSSFNTRARAFYANNGFVQSGHLDDLIAPGHAELLLRKRLR